MQGGGPVTVDHSFGGSSPRWNASKSLPSADGREGGGMRIGVIGSGQVGQTLAQGLKKHGYETRIASRTVDKLADFSKSSGIHAGTPAEVAAWAEGVVLAVKGDAAEAAVREAVAANLSGKLVIDTTNPIAQEPP